MKTNTLSKRRIDKNTKIVVIGGSGLIGAKLVKNLRQQGHEVLPASPSSGVNTITGEGLAEALEGAHVVVDVANSPSFEDKAQRSSLSSWAASPNPPPRGKRCGCHLPLCGPSGRMTSLP